MAEDLLDFVVSVGTQLKRTEEDVTPYHKILEENWYDSVDDIAQVKPEQLVTLGIPLRFANALVDAAAGNGEAAAPAARSEKGEKGKGKGKGKKGKKRSKRDDDYGGGESSEIITLGDVDPGFNMKGKLLGHKGTNVHHIQDLYGVKLHIDERCKSLEISGPDRNSVQRAADMCHDLVRVSYEDYDAWLAGESPSDGKGKREGKGKGKDKGKSKGKGKGKDKGSRGGKDGNYTQTIDITDAERHREFHMKGKIVGDGGKNVFYIQDQSHAKVNVEDDGEGLHVHISADNEDDLQAAAQMTQDLIDAVMADYDQWINEDGGEGGDDEDGGSKGSKKGKRKGKKGKGKGKEKGKWRSYDDEPPAKRHRT